MNNGERFSTYAIRAPRGSGEVSLNGAAARQALIGDLLIVAAYSTPSVPQLDDYKPVIALVDEHNRAKD